LFNEGAGSTVPGEPYEMKFPTEFSNVGIRLVDRPDVVSKYFAQSNCIDKHNHVRQSELALEKRWVTHDPFFRLHTTIVLVGMNVVDCWKLAGYHGLFDGLPSNQHRLPDHTMPIKKFAGVLSFQLLLFANTLKTSSSISVPFTVITEESEPASSLDNFGSSPTTGTNHSMLSSYTDANGFLHRPIPFQSTKHGSRRGIKPRRCFYCRVEGKPNSGGWARHSCSHCNKAYCCPGPRNDGRNCFRLHVEDIRHQRKRRVGV
jgi:hypothetical protein